MPSDIFSFRLTPAEIAKLNNFKRSGESLTLCAKRLLLEVINGHSPRPTDDVEQVVVQRANSDEAMLTSLVNALMEAKLAEVNASLEANTKEAKSSVGWKRELSQTCSTLSNRVLVCAEKIEGLARRLEQVEILSLQMAAFAPPAQEDEFVPSIRTDDFQSSGDNLGDVEQLVKQAALRKDEAGVGEPVDRVQQPSDRVEQSVDRVELAEPQEAEQSVDRLDLEEPQDVEQSVKQVVGLADPQDVEQPVDCVKQVAPQDVEQTVRQAVPAAELQAVEQAESQDVEQPADYVEQAESQDAEQSVDRLDLEEPQDVEQSVKQVVGLADPQDVEQPVDCVKQAESQDVEQGVDRVDLEEPQDVEQQPVFTSELEGETVLDPGVSSLQPDPESTTLDLGALDTTANQDNPPPIAGNGGTTSVTNSSASATPTNSPQGGRYATEIVQPELFTLEQPVSDGLNQGGNVQPNTKPAPSTVGLESEIEFFTAAELAALLAVHYSSVIQAAAKGIDYFRDWSKSQGQGTFEFEVINPGSPKPRKRFFKVGEFR